MVKFLLPEQSEPWCPSWQLQNPVVGSHCPFPLHGVSPPGHDLPANKKNVLPNNYKFENID